MRAHPVEWLCRRIMRALIIAALAVGTVFTLAWLGDEQEPHEWRYVTSTDHPAFAVFVVCASLLAAWGGLAITRRAMRPARGRVPGLHGDAAMTARRYALLALAVAVLLILTYLGVSDVVDAINKDAPSLDLDGDGIVGPGEPGYVTPTGGSR